MTPTTKYDTNVVVNCEILGRQFNTSQDFLTDGDDIYLHRAIMPSDALLPVKYFIQALASSKCFINASFKKVGTEQDGTLLIV